MRILGISAFYHDSAAALVEDGDRRRRPGRALHPQEARRAFPANARSAIASQKPGSPLTRLDHVVFYDKPFLKFERLLETYLALRAARLSLVPEWPCRCGSARSCSRRTCCASELKDIRSANFDAGRSCCFAEHHLSHAAAPSFPRRSRKRWCLPWTASANGPRPRRRSGDGNGSISSRRSISRIRSACLYSAFTYYTGFKVNSGEYKLMGLAPYGEPRYARRHSRSI